MKLDNATREHYLAKQAFIRKVGEAFHISDRASVVDVDLQVFEHKKEDWIQEYLVITFLGGAISVRSANINSDSANFRELGRLIDGGYYSEVEDYCKILASEDWERIV